MGTQARRGAGAWATASGEGSILVAPRNLVLIVEDDVHVARALERVVRRHVDVAVVDAAAAALDRVQSEVDAEWVGAIVDVGLPDRSGLELAIALRAASPNLALLVITGSDTREAANVAVEAGAQFAFKPVSSATLDAFVSRSIAGRPQARIEAEVRSLARESALSDREEELVRVAARGVERAQLAARLDVSENTVKTQVRSVLTKCGAETLEDLVRRVLRGAMARAV